MKFINFAFATVVFLQHCESKYQKNIFPLRPVSNAWLSKQVSKAFERKLTRIKLP